MHIKTQDQLDLVQDILKARSAMSTIAYETCNIDLYTSIMRGDERTAEGQIERLLDRANDALIIVRDRLDGNGLSAEERTAQERQYRLLRRKVSTFEELFKLLRSINERNVEHRFAGYSITLMRMVNDAIAERGEHLHVRS